MNEIMWVLQILV